MIKTDESIAHESSVSACWKEAPNCLALRVESEEGGIFLLPYRHLAFCHTLTSEGGDQLSIVFATHAVILKGRRLRALLSALQKETVQWIRTIPARYEALQGPEGAAIFSIKVETEIREDRE